MKKIVKDVLITFIIAFINICDILNFFGVSNLALWGSIVTLVLFPCMFYNLYVKGKNKDK